MLRIRANNYYRIELPCASEEDKAQVEQLRVVLESVLQYEKTACPFKRGFTVDLPEPPPVPIQKKPWKPKPKDMYHHDGRLSDVSEPDFRSKIIAQQDSHAGPAQDQPIVEPGSPRPFRGSSASSVIGDIPADIEAANSEGFMQKNRLEQSEEELPHMKTPTRPKRILTGRTVTAPPQLTLRHSPPSTATTGRSLATLKQESPSLSSSVDSFHSFHSPISPLSQSPPSPKSDPLGSTKSNLAAPRVRGHRRDESESTITTDSHDLWDLSGTEDESSVDRPRTPTLVSDVASQDDLWDEVQTPSPPGLRVRRTLQKRRTHSPLPSSANLYTPYPPRREISGHHLTTAIIQRTCSLLLGPPLQLIALMIKIAARIVRGALQGSSFGYGEGGERIPCTWDFSSDGSDSSDDLWDEDDYGVSLGKTVSGREVRTKDTGGSWEID